MLFIFSGIHYVTLLSYQNDLYIKQKSIFSGHSQCALICRCELTYIQQSRVISGFQASVWTVGPRLLYVVVVIPSALSGVVLLPERLYICLALLFILTHTFLGCVFLAITRASESVTTLNRIKVRIVRKLSKGNSKLESM